MFCERCLCACAEQLNLDCGSTVQSSVHPFLLVNPCGPTTNYNRARQAPALIGVQSRERFAGGQGMQSSMSPALPRRRAGGAWSKGGYPAGCVLIMMPPIPGAELRSRMEIAALMEKCPGGHRQRCLISVESSGSWLPAGHSMLERDSRLHGGLGTRQGCQPLWVLICARLHQLVHLQRWKLFLSEYASGLMPCLVSMLSIVRHTAGKAQSQPWLCTSHDQPYTAL